MRIPMHDQCPSLYVLNLCKCLTGVPQHPGTPGTLVGPQLPALIAPRTMDTLVASAAATERKRCILDGWVFEDSSNRDRCTVMKTQRKNLPAVDHQSVETTSLIYTRLVRIIVLRNLSHDQKSSRPSPAYPTLNSMSAERATPSLGVS